MQQYNENILITPPLKEKLTFPSCTDGGIYAILSAVNP